MNLRKTILCSLLLAVGMILHQITPPLLVGVKPDFLLAMMFIAILITDDYKFALVIGITSGILTAATTTFPGGQIPNVIDKIITAHVIFFINKFVIRKFNTQVKIIIVSIFGTLLSGTIFLTSALLLVGLPAPFIALVLTVVLPATLLNTIVASILYNAVSLAMKYSTN